MSIHDTCTNIFGHVYIYIYLLIYLLYIHMYIQMLGSTYTPRMNHEEIEDHWNISWSPHHHPTKIDNILKTFNTPNVILSLIRSNGHKSYPKHMTILVTILLQTEIILCDLACLCWTIQFTVTQHIMYTLYICIYIYLIIDNDDNIYIYTCVHTYTRQTFIHGIFIGAAFDD